MLGQGQALRAGQHAAAIEPDLDLDQHVERDAVMRRRLGEGVDITDIVDQRDHMRPTR